MSMIMIHPEQLYQMIAGAAVVASKTTAMMMGGCSDMMLKTQAYAKYGNKTVKKWHKDGLLHPKRQGTCVYYPVIELMVASQSEIVNRLTPNALDEIRMAINEFM